MKNMEKEDEVTEPAWISKMVNMLKNTEEEFENIISIKPTVNNWTKPSENKLSKEDMAKMTFIKLEIEGRNCCAPTNPLFDEDYYNMKHVRWLKERASYKKRNR